MSKTLILTASATAQLGGDSKISSVVVSSAINSLTSVNVSVLPDAGQGTVQEVGAPDVISALAGYQQKKYAGNSSEVTVNVNDGQKDATFKGVIAQPAYVVGPTNFNFSVGCTGGGYQVQALRTDIYSSPSGSRLKEGTASPPSGSVTERLRGVLEQMISNWQKDLDGKALSTDPIGLKIAQRVHEQNKDGLAAWYAILDASKVEFPGLTGSPEIDVYIAQYITEVYLGASENFFDTIMRFCAAFKMIFVPGTGSGKSAGKLVSMSEVVGNPTGQAALVDELNITLGDAASAPVVAVVVKGLGSVEFKGSANEDDGAERTYAIYPPNIGSSKGRIMAISPPPWLISAYAPTALGEGELATGLDPTQYLSSVQTPRTASVSDLLKQQGVILSAWARMHYLDAALSDSTAIVGCALDVTWEVGKRYNVSRRGGGAMFAGFLSQLTHTLVLESAAGQGKGMARTQLVFSHVEVGGFSLPGK